MIENQKDGIKKSMPARREAECLRVVTDIVIPRGTILRKEGGSFFCFVKGGKFTVEDEPAAIGTAYQKVVAA